MDLIKQARQAVEENILALLDDQGLVVPRLSDWDRLQDSLDALIMAAQKQSSTDPASVGDLLSGVDPQ